MKAQPYQKGQAFVFHLPVSLELGAAHQDRPFFLARLGSRAGQKPHSLACTGNSCGLRLGTLLVGQGWHMLQTRHFIHLPKGS